MVYFIRIGGKTQDPFDAATLKQLAADGKLDRNAEVSRDRQNWSLARDVSGLVFPDEELAKPPSGDEFDEFMDDVLADLPDADVFATPDIAPGTSVSSPAPPPPSQPPNPSSPPGPPPTSNPTPSTSRLSVRPCRDCTKLISTRGESLSPLWRSVARRTGPVYPAGYWSVRNCGDGIWNARNAILRVRLRYGTPGDS